MNNILALIHAMQNSIYGGGNIIDAIRTCYEGLLPIHYRNRLYQSSRGGGFQLSMAETTYLDNMIADMQSVLSATYSGPIPVRDSEYGRRIINRGNEILQLATE